LSAWWNSRNTDSFPSCDVSTRKFAAAERANRSSVGSLTRPPSASAATRHSAVVQPGASA